MAVHQALKMFTDMKKTTESTCKQLGHAQPIKTQTTSKLNSTDQANKTDGLIQHWMAC